MEPRTPAADALTELFLEVFRVNGDLLAEGDRITRDLGQTSARWQVLGAIRNRAETVAQIARTMGLARQSVQRTADLLEREGVVEYAPNPAHRRAKLVRLTAAGKETLSRISQRQVEWTTRLARALPFGESEIRDAVVVLRAVRTELESTRSSARVRTSAENEGKSIDREGGKHDGERRSHQSVRSARKRRG